MDETIKDRLLDRIPSEASVIIYGAGRYGKNILKIIMKYRKDIKILGFADTYKRGIIEGLRVFSPLELKKIVPNCDIIIIASASFIDEMVATVKDMGCDVVIPAEFGRNISQEDREKIEWVRRRIKSGLDLYDRVIDARIRGDITMLTRSINNPERQYIDYIDLQRVKVLLDGGIFDGRMAIRLLDLIDREGIIVGFDPWGDQFLCSEAKNSDRITVVPKALWSCSRKLRFYVGYDEMFAGSSFVSECDSSNETIEIDAVSLDEFVYNSKIHVDYIKLDIEGAEPEAILGAKDLIKEMRPDMAISIYHDFTHLYEIPIMVMSIVSVYEMYFGLYSKELSDSVMYFIAR